MKKLAIIGTVAGVLFIGNCCALTSPPSQQNDTDNNNTQNKQQIEKIINQLFKQADYQHFHHYPKLILFKIPTREML